MKNDSNTDKIVWGIAAIISILITVVLTPILALLFGMFLGWVIEMFAGNIIIQALHAVGLENATISDIPALFGVFVLILSFIQATVYTIVRKSDK